MVWVNMTALLWLEDLRCHDYNKIHVVDVMERLISATLTVGGKREKNSGFSCLSHIFGC